VGRRCAGRTDRADAGQGHAEAGGRAERLIRLWASPQGAAKAAIAGTTETFWLGANPGTLFEDGATKVLHTSVAWEGGKPVVTFPLPGVPGAMATATLDSKFMTERVVVTQGKTTTQTETGDVYVVAPVQSRPPRLQARMSSEWKKPPRPSHVKSFFTRQGDVLLYDVTVEDPEVLVEPYVFPTRVVRRNPNPDAGLVRERGNCEVYETDDVTSQIRH
jgi:hypothetical protein